MSPRLLRLLPRFAILALVLTPAPGRAQTADPRKCDLGEGPAVSAARYAITCAEEFVRLNGYTGYPPADSAMISRESGESARSIAELLDLRRNTLEPNAFGVCVGENGEGYVVAFRYRDPSMAQARAVVMSAAFDELRVYHQDFILSLVPERQHGCRPATDDLNAGTGG